MTNNTNTLNGALTELGETMADNLTTMGVTSNANEGLTTLANKILLIPTSGGAIVTFDGVTLTSDKNILSYVDNDYATLTAQLTDNGSNASVSGQSVSFMVYDADDDTLLDTLTGTTDNTGVATVVYYAEDAGDIYIKANCQGILSEEIYVEDLYYHPLLDGSESKTKYGNYGSTCTISNGVMANGCYYLNQAFPNQNKEWEVSFDMNLTTYAGIVLIKQGTTTRDSNLYQIYYNGILLDGSAINGTTARRKTVYDDDTTIDYTRSVWIHVKITKTTEYVQLEDSTGTITIYLASDISDTSKWWDAPNLCIGIDSWGSNAQLKNIKVHYL